MPNESHVLIQPTTSARDFSASRFALSRDYLALTKPEINVLVLITTVGGFYLAAINERGSFPLKTLISTVVGTLLVASAAGTLNQVLEKDFDGRMKRTVGRPVAAGRVDAAHALWFGIALGIAGGALLWIDVNAFAASLAMAALSLYLAVYTPLKRTSPLCTLVGAVSGAIPPLIGWFAVSHYLSSEALALFALLFLWQLPHFMAIAWVYRDDYARAGYQVLPQNGKQARFVAWWSVAPAVLLIGLLIAVMFARGELVYLPLAYILGGCFLYYSVRLALEKTNAAARQLFTMSILYIPVALSLLIFVERYRRLTP